ncbi:TetR/AcrR family transcriptional regulator [Ideonella dechloratans]|uniref:TetR/AcrR family transcriptional regulator n=1 Tax=Ideonella dechloratans TaxID=36863 RepID=A0A643F9J9_IDEDE|nr:TetR/AcrR family transcriptional regulator [Ideonella dechloratans]KAB0576822.1 TetR/AcrR family transcriptional regulator [Ideonella dechloratans]UFU09861.1 TetR family transcriptional regulator [Ideonella dechloratans]
MARPSQAVDQALIASALALYPQCGCAGLSLRKVAEHAGTQPAMVHYHFGGKPAFLRAVLQQLYEQMFAALNVHGRGEERPRDRLRGALLTLGRFLRQHRAVAARLALDAAQGEPVVHDFLRANAPRHLGLLLALLQEAQGAGELQALPPLQAFTFLMGAVNAPTLIATGALQLGVAPALLGELLDQQVLSDEALVQRVDLALAALGPSPRAAAAAGASP